ncbi:MAG: UMP kinase [Spirochaetia bacterium]|jgi:uridylate kinase|nr:UMP kinase [Spirochaetales bacterium]MDX9784684.1 UMP kinase [Spirochaetia bacterium]
MTYVLSLGGSIVAPPEGPDTEFMFRFRASLETWLATDSSRRVILVIGGGGPARAYQNALREFWRLRGEALSSDPNRDAALDWLGIAATKINAQFVKAAMAELCSDEVVTDPSGPIVFSGRVLVASGWKPGFSSDYDAVLLAERFNATTLLNLSNIAKVYTADPKLDPSARPIDEISWEEFRAMVGSSWKPGANLPFDPIASARAQASKITVICAAGRNIPNTIAILEGRDFEGSTIGAISAERSARSH